MDKNFENDEIVIDFNKIFKIIQHRFVLIVIIYTITISLTLLYSLFIQPKIYKSSALILMNKSEDTNLTDINPFTISEMGGMLTEKGLSGLLSSGSSSMNNDLDILKSPLVMDKVIKDNNLIYQQGPKKGKYINGIDLANSKNLKINNMKNSQTIEIIYKSSDPQKAYNIVSSILKNYIEVYENINSQKAHSDKEFLQQSYLSARQDLDKKLEKLKKEFKLGSSANSESSGSQGLLSLYNKRLRKDLHSLALEGIDLEKLETEIKQEYEKIKMIKTKLEWITLVEQMSKNATNITILKEPELKEPFEYSEPNLLINILLSLVVSFTISVIAVSGLEFTSKSLTYSDMDTDANLIQKNQIDLSNLKALTLTKKIKHFSVIFLANNIKNDKYLEMIKDEITTNNLKLTLSTISNTLDEHIKNIASSESIIVISELGYTNKKLYYQIKNVAKELNQIEMIEFLIV